MKTGCILTIPPNWITIVTVNIRTAGLVGGEETDDGSLVVDEGDYDACIAVLLVDGTNVCFVGKFNPVGAICLSDV